MSEFNVGVYQKQELFLEFNVCVSQKQELKKCIVPMMGVGNPKSCHLSIYNNYCNEILLCTINSVFQHLNLYITNVTMVYSTM